MLILIILNLLNKGVFMKLMWKKGLALFSFIFFLSVTQFGCLGIGEDGKKQEQRVLSSIEIKSVCGDSMTYNSSLKLTVEGSYSDGSKENITNNVEWSVDNQNVNIEANGKVTNKVSKPLGKVVITARSKTNNDIKADFVFNVVSLIAEINNVHLISNPNLAIKAGLKDRLAVEARLVDGTIIDDLSTGVNFTVKESNVIQIDGSSITAKNPGTAKIIVSADDISVFTKEVELKAIPYYAYVLSKDESKVFTFAQNFESGNLKISKDGLTVNTLPNPVNMVFASSGNFAYVLSKGDSLIKGGISIYSIDKITGSLANINKDACTNECMDAENLIIAPSGNFAYVLKDEQSDSVSTGSIIMFNIDKNSGELKLNDAKIQIGTEPKSMIFDPSGKFAYVLNKNSHNVDVVSVFNVNTESGVLTKQEVDYQVGPSPISMKFGLNGHQLYVVNEEKVTVFDQDQKTGALNEKFMSIVGDKATSITFAPFANFAYVVNTASQNLSMFKIDVASGKLNPLSMLSPKLGIDPTFMEFDILGKYAYVVNSSEKVITVLSYKQDGSLEVIKESSDPLQGNPTAIVIQ